MTRTTLGPAAMVVAALSGCADTKAPTAPADAAPSFRATAVTSKEDFDTTIVAFEPCSLAQAQSERVGESIEGLPIEAPRGPSTRVAPYHWWWRREAV